MSNTDNNTLSDSSLRIVILGLSITSSWGNGHAATYRGLMRGLHERGHRTVFLERDVPWYASHRDLAEPPYGRTFLYDDLEDLRRRFLAEIRSADLVIVGSYVPEGVDVGKFVLNQARGVTAFYDIDTPVTLAKLRRQDFEYLDPQLIGEYDMYLSFTGGPTLDKLEETYGSPMARAFHCAVDKAEYYPEPADHKWLMGYLGTYSDDRQPRVESMLNEPARRLSGRNFVVAGPSYPSGIDWPANVARVDHIPPPEHRHFYNGQRFTLNVTRDDMIAAGYSPSVRLFEAAACATPIISDVWEGIDTLFEPGEEISVGRLRRRGHPVFDADHRRGVPRDRAARAPQGARRAHPRPPRRPARAVRRAGTDRRHGLPGHASQEVIKEVAMDTLQSRGNRDAGKASEELLELGPWFHNLHLPGGVQTAPNHPLGDFPAFKWEQLRNSLPEDLTGWRALDIGCNAGFYCFELARLGAEVVGIDMDPHYLRQAHWACDKLGMADKVSFRQMQVYELARSPDTYDLVLFMGVFYHLRYPLLAMDIIAERTERMLAFQSLSMGEDEVVEQPEDFAISERQRFDQPGWPKLAFVRRRFNADPTNWWVPNHACIEAMLADVGFDIVARPGDEMYVCRSDTHRQQVSLRNPAELAAAVGPRHRSITHHPRGRLNDGGSAQPAPSPEDER